MALNIVQRDESKDIRTHAWHPYTMHNLQYTHMHGHPYTMHNLQYTHMHGHPYTMHNLQRT